MNDAPHPALLPAGLYDLLPPEAQVEADVTARLLGVLAAHGYERVKPPLVEFEDTLLSGTGTAMASDTFRTMDPSSHRMVGVRADMTPQVARIAATRLSHRPRPLRLSYAGQVLRVKGSQMQPERQIGQAGAELIGAAGAAADVEAIAVAGEALAAVGVPHLSVDITLPTLVPAIADAYGIDGERGAALRAALDHKDVAAVANLAGEAGELLAQLVAAAGPCRTARAALDRLDLPERAHHERARLGEVLDGLALAIPALKVTVDPVENRNFEYHTGISFTFFARVDPEHGPLGELGRGGRYEAGAAFAPEPATGFTLYTDTILRTLQKPPRRRRVLVPLGADRDRAASLRRDGWITVAALRAEADWREEARRLDCGYVLEGGEPWACVTPERR
ncbi:MAG TPA: ATP phosphoribosyltransferase regulatory subunit [Stellaceae bacterium]|jgi:ATP phosphoribosyltransferase regulatory subunit|nr:ATP phosphoribosyltransferase regulatory subunit [Stellaceae bacterium]